MAAALKMPVTVSATAGEGGPWGMALLALYADENLGKSERSTDGWSAALFGLESYEATSYWLKHEQDDFVASEKYWNLKRRIHGLKI